jgi:hypothetical protein
MSRALSFYFWSGLVAVFALQRTMRCCLGVLALMTAWARTLRVFGLKGTLARCFLVLVIRFLSPLRELPHQAPLVLPALVGAVVWFAAPHLPPWPKDVAPWAGWALLFSAAVVPMLITQAWLLMPPTILVLGTSRLTSFEAIRILHSATGLHPVALINRTSLAVTGQYFDVQRIRRREAIRTGSLLTRFLLAGQFEWVAPPRSADVIRTREGVWGWAVQMIAASVKVIVIDARYSSEATLAEARWLRQIAGPKATFWVIDGDQHALLDESGQWQPPEAPAPVTATPETITQRVIEAIYGERRPKSVQAWYKRAQLEVFISEAAARADAEGLPPL